MMTYDEWIFLLTGHLTSDELSKLQMEAKVNGKFIGTKPEYDDLSDVDFITADMLILVDNLSFLQYF